MVKGKSMSKVVLIIFFIFNSYSQDKVIYKYKKRESIDLGELSLQGNVVSPGDLSSKQRETRKIKFKIPVRKNFDDLSIENLESSL